MERSSASEEVYGYWITDKGELLKVEHQEHGGLADRYVLKHHYKEFFAYINKIDAEDTGGFALADSKSFVKSELGWLRVVIEGNILNIDFIEDSIARNAYTALTKFIKENEFTQYTIDLQTKGGEYKYQRYDIEENKHDMSKMLAFLRQNIDKSRHVQIEGSIGMEAVLAKGTSYVEARSPYFSIKAKVHFTVLASEAEKRLTCYMRRKNGKKV